MLESGSPSNESEPSQSPDPGIQSAVEIDLSSASLNTAIEIEESEDFEDRLLKVRADMRKVRGLLEAKYNELMKDEFVLRPSEYQEFARIFEKYRWFEHAEEIRELGLDNPPEFDQNPKAFTLHGDTRIDEFTALHNLEDEDVLDYVDRENEYADLYRVGIEEVVNEIYEELKGYRVEDYETHPTLMGRDLYFERYEKGKQYPIVCRIPGGKKKAQVLIDANELAEGHEYASLVDYVPSPNDRYLAYAVDFEGNEHCTICILDLKTGKLLEDRLETTAGGIAWSKDSSTIIYEALDHKERSYKVMGHVLGEQQSDDRVIYHEEDGAFSVSAYASASGKYLIISTGSGTTTENLVVDADNPFEEPTLVTSRMEGVERYIEHVAGRFFIHSNRDAPNFRLFETTEDKLDPSEWQEIVPARDGVYLKAIECFKDFLVRFESEEANTKLIVTQLSTGETHEVEFPEKEEAYTLEGDWVWDKDTNQIPLSYESFKTPNRYYEYHMDTKELELILEDEMPENYDPGEWTVEKTYATSADGTKVPISLVYDKDLVKDGSAPLWLNGYGAYGEGLAANFDSYPRGFARFRQALLERGFVIAIAHVRGGDELGREWYDQGKLEHKQNSFDDFIACAEHLHKEGYASPEKTVIEGRSAGGLLMGAVVNQRPDIARVAILGVPFVDAVTTMLDDEMPLVEGEKEEWGDPKNPEDYFRMKGYGPYENIERKDYPSILVTTGLEDPRVNAREPLKYVARLRDRKTDENVVLLQTDLEAGHFGSSGRYDYLKKMAFKVAFILNELGMTDDYYE